MGNAEEGGIHYINYMSATLEDIKKFISERREREREEKEKKKADMNKQFLLTLL